MHSQLGRTELEVPDVAERDVDGEGVGDGCDCVCGDKRVLVGRDVEGKHGKVILMVSCKRK